jgi:hypothetical protein
VVVAQLQQVSVVSVGMPVATVRVVVVVVQA